MKKIILALILFLFLGTSSVAAQNQSEFRNVNDCVSNSGFSLTQCNKAFGVDGASEGGITNPVIGDLGSSPEAASSGFTFGSYLITIWQTLTVVGGLALLLYLLWGSIDWLVAGGDSGKVQKARDKMTNAVIGFIILLGSFAIIGFIGELIGYNLLNISFPTAGGA